MSAAPRTALWGGEGKGGVEGEGEEDPLKGGGRRRRVGEGGGERHGTPRGRLPRGGRGERRGGGEGVPADEGQGNAFGGAPSLGSGGPSAPVNPGGGCNASGGGATRRGS